MRPIGAFLTLALALATLPTQAQESASYSIKRLSITQLAGPSDSASFTAEVTAESVSGAVGICPAGTTSSLGFWSFLAPSDVPVVLRIARTATDPEIELRWTGQSSSFDVFRSTSPTDVTDQANLLTQTGACESIDTNPSGTLLFYVVNAGP